VEHSLGWTKISHILSLQIWQPSAKPVYHYQHLLVVVINKKGDDRIYLAYKHQQHEQAGQ